MARRKSGRKRSKTSSRVTRGGLTAIKVGKDDVFLFTGKKLSTGKIGLFFSKGQLRIGRFTKGKKPSLK